MSASVSRRVQALARSEIRNMSSLCDSVGGINLSQGICDMPLPPGLAEAAKASVDAGENHYTAHDGLPCLREAVARKLSHSNGISADPEGEVVITSGASGAFYSACLALLEPGDEVILFEPFYGYHEYTLHSLGIVPLYAELSPGDWCFDAEKVESLVTPRTKGMLVNTPANPSGKVFSAGELAQLADICARRNLLLFTDEIYEHFVYDGLRHISPGALHAAIERTVTISGFSKTFSITGWRLGYCSCRRELAGPVALAHDLVYVCAPAPLQAAVAAALPKIGAGYYTALRESFQRKRDLVCEALREARLTPYIPKGTYYVLADASAVPGETALEKALHILDKTGVAVVPGSAFYRGGGGENLVRLCFAKKGGVLEEACERLQKLKK
jgi:aminotransferase